MKGPQGIGYFLYLDVEVGEEGEEHEDVEECEDRDPHRIPAADARHSGQHRHADQSAELDLQNGHGVWSKRSDMVYRVYRVYLVETE